MSNVFTEHKRIEPKTLSTLIIPFWFSSVTYINAILICQCRHVLCSPGVVKRCFWGMMTAVCVFILVYHLTSSCILYFSYETDVNVALITRRQLTFPAVTICNLNPVKSSAVSDSSALSRLINDVRRKRKKRDTSASSRLVNDDTHKGEKRENSVFSGITKHDKKKRYKRETSASLRTHIEISGKGTCLVAVHGECECII